VAAGLLVELARAQDEADAGEDRGEQRQGNSATVIGESGSASHSPRATTGRANITSA